MGSIIKRKVQEGVHWIEIPGANLKMLCGCPADSIKHLSRKGLLRMEQKEGITYESGPNAILLSDYLIQNGSLSNLAEFPAYHMFYTQGMINPSHPNYFNPKPLLIGNRTQVKAQMSYITWGNYGLTRESQFLSVGETAEFAHENINIKRQFAQGRFLHTRYLMTPVYLDEHRAELRSGVIIERNEPNLFEIRFRKEAVRVDLNLSDKGKYRATFKVPQIRIPQHTFSIVHAGEGDGWNPDKPSVASLIQVEGTFYLVDAGPFILETLTRFGLEPADLQGVFITHVHDDHFAGLYDLMNLPERIRIYATPVVQATVVKKMSALLSCTEKRVRREFEFLNLRREQWNRCQGLEVKPITTAHPVDTTLFLFRVRRDGVVRTYGHYCDIAALEWLRRMSIEQGDATGITASYLDNIRDVFSLKLNLKKIDIGGPPIHGKAEDFAQDQSDKLVLCHTHHPFTPRELCIGSAVEMGDIDILFE